MFTNLFGLLAAFLTPVQMIFPSTLPSQSPTTFSSLHSTDTSTSTYIHFYTPPTHRHTPHFKVMEFNNQQSNPYAVNYPQLQTTPLFMNNQPEFQQQYGGNHATPLFMNNQPGFQQQRGGNQAVHWPAYMSSDEAQFSGVQQPNTNQWSYPQADLMPMQDQAGIQQPMNFNRFNNGPFQPQPVNTNWQTGTLNTIGSGVQRVHIQQSQQPLAHHMATTPVTAQKQPAPQSTTSESVQLETLTKRLRQQISSSQENQIWIQYVSQTPREVFNQLYARCIDPVMLHCRNHAKRILQERAARQMVPAPIQEQITTTQPTSGTQGAPIALDDDEEEEEEEEVVVVVVEVKKKVATPLPTPSSTASSLNLVPSPKPKANMVNVTDKMYAEGPAPKENDLIWNPYCTMGWMNMHKEHYHFSKAAKSHKFYVNEDDSKDWYCVRIHDGAKKYGWQIDAELSALELSEEEAKREHAKAAAQKRQRKSRETAARVERLAAATLRAEERAQKKEQKQLEAKRKAEERAQQKEQKRAGVANRKRKATADDLDDDLECKPTKRTRTNDEASESNHTESATDLDALFEENDDISATWLEVEDDNGDSQSTSATEMEQEESTENLDTLFEEEDESQASQDEEDEDEDEDISRDWVQELENELEASQDEESEDDDDDEDISAAWVQELEDELQTSQDENEENGDSQPAWTAEVEQAEYQGYYSDSSEESEEE